MSWAEAELGGAQLGDQRLTKRLVKLVDTLSAAPTASIPAACRGWAETKAAYRLLDNDAVDWRDLLEPHWVCSEQRMSAYDRVLCIQDTTELDFTTHPGTAGRGRLNHDARQGLYLHPTLAVSPDGVALGVLDAWLWARAARGEVAVPESRRWIEGYERIGEQGERRPGTRLVYVADREADIRELIDTAARLGHPADYLVRAYHDRSLAGGERLWRSFEGCEALGTVQFERPAQPGQASRLVTQEVFLQRVTLADRGHGEQPVTAILAREIDPPAGVKPIEWRLLTNEVLTTLDEVVERIEWYRKRWLIEIFFRILKSGCRVEAQQLATLERLERGLAIYLIIAWRILLLVTLGREVPELDCEVLFTPEEWRAAWIVAYHQTPPETPPPLGEMVALVGRFGGHLGRKRDGPPGPKALWQGLQCVMNYVEALQAVGHFDEPGIRGERCG
jgi:hypothetical protein